MQVTKLCQEHINNVLDSSESTRKNIEYLKICIIIRHDILQQNLVEVKCRMHVEKFL